jgi:hypothetical protein
VNIGTTAFTRAYKLNSWWCWITVVLLAGCYTTFVLKNDVLNRQVDTSPYLDVFDDPSCVRSNPLSLNNAGTEILNLEEEKSSLLVQSSLQSSASPSIRDSASSSAQLSVPGSVRIAASTEADMLKPPTKSSSSSSSMRSVPLWSTESYRYGALVKGDDSYLSILPDIRSSFLVSWRGELLKTRLLIEIIFASWAIWIIRSDIALIFKLSPLAQGVAWGRCPLWILNVFLLVALTIVAMSFSKKFDGE